MIEVIKGAQENNKLSLATPIDWILYELMFYLLHISVVTLIYCTLTSSHTRFYSRRTFDARLSLKTNSVLILKTQKNAKLEFAE